MKKAIGYIRVSHESQVETGLSLDAQRAKIEAYAALKDLSLVEIIEDAGISAKNLKRPGMQRVLELAHRKEVEAVIILKLDRMFRNTVDALETARMFDKKGIALHSIAESLDTHSALGKFFFTLTAALAEMERGLIGERTRTALAQKKARGEKTGGHVPYGFSLVGKRLVPDAREQEVLQRMSALRKQGMSFQRVADLLNAEGILTKKGTAWDRARVFKTLQNAA